MSRRRGGFSAGRRGLFRCHLDPAYLAKEHTMKHSTPGAAKLGTIQALTCGSRRFGILDDYNALYYIWW